MTRSGTLRCREVSLHVEKIQNAHPKLYVARRDTHRVPNSSHTFVNLCDLDHVLIPLACPSSCYKVVEACCLKPDLDQFEGGDLTEVGEKGITVRCGERNWMPTCSMVYDVECNEIVVPSTTMPSDQTLNPFKNWEAPLSGRTGLLPLVAGKSPHLARKSSQ